MKNPVAFRDWLPKKVRPLAIAVVLFGFVFSSVILALAAYEGFLRWDNAIQAWGRSAEILISKRDLASLDAVTEFLRREYPSVQLEIQTRSEGRSKKTIWSYPQWKSDVNTDEKGFFSRSMSLNGDSGFEASAEVQWTEVVRSAIGAALLVFVLFVFTLLMFRRIFRFCISRIVYEVAQLKGGERSQILELTELVIERERSEKLRVEAESRAILGSLAAQVAHDIRSPLAALSAAERDLIHLPEESRILVRSAVSRIKDIAHSLIEKNREQLSISKSKETDRSESKIRAVCHMPSLLDGILSEKRLQYRSIAGVEIFHLTDASSYGLFGLVEPVELKRVLSNLINNSIEALNGSGRIEIKLTGNTEKIELSILDDGKGIPSHIISNLGQLGQTFGKAGGSGLGLFHAKTTVEGWGGNFSIESNEGKGTCITLVLPTATAPAWFVPALDLKENMSLFILDDDASIHQIWDGRFKAHKLLLNFEVFHFSEISSLKERTLSEGIPESACFLVDYEIIGSSSTGLKLIEELGLAVKSILVTSRYEDDYILKECSRLGVRIIPKNMAGFIPIGVQKKKELWDAVLLDDDALVRLCWRLSAEKKGKRIRLFSNLNELLQKLNSIDLSTPFFIDVKLGEGIRGEMVARQLYDLGYENISLTTGYDPAAIEPSPCIRGVLGKEAPWGE